MESHTFVNILKILTYMLYISYSGKVFFASYTLQILTFVIAEASFVLTVVIYIIAIFKDYSTLGVHYRDLQARVHEQISSFLFVNECL